MIAFLLDGMYPTAAAELLRDEHGLSAVHVAEVGLGATADADIASAARAHGWVLVTENVVDFAGERDLVLVFVLKKNLPAGGGQAQGLAGLLHRWAAENRDPYIGHHWPATRPAHEGHPPNPATLTAPPPAYPSLPHDVIL